MKLATARMLPVILLPTLLSAGATTPASVRDAVNTSIQPCDLEALESSKHEFNRLVTHRRFAPATVSAEQVSAASLDYVLKAEACFAELYGPPSQVIDDGGVWLDDGQASFNLIGSKWGAGSPYASTGFDNTGPHSPGGTVTYSFMADGVSMTGDPATAAGSNIALSSLPGYQACFVTEIANAFAAWSAVANIQFVQVADNGVAFNGAGATGDIRIGAHTFDGPSQALAHGFYPPPNGTSAAGDLHFDRQENWSCTSAGGIDIGIVTMHEIGHALGLGHESRGGRRALMNSTYNPSVASLLLGDDVDGAVNVYGSSTGATDDLVINFGLGVGVWRYDYGVGWSPIHAVAPEQIVAADVDGNGIDDLAVDFGSVYGLWIFKNRASWSPLHGLSPTLMTAGDLDGNGLDDLVAHFAGFGIFGWYNDAGWQGIHAATPSLMTTGNIDGVGGDDLIINFPGQGVWAFRNNGSWGLLNGIDASVMVAGRLDAASGAQDLLIGFPGFGLIQYTNDSAWSLVHGLVPRRLALGDLDSNGRDDVAVDFGAGVGLWTLTNGSTWTPLHTALTDSLALGDLDGNGQDEIAIDFGATYGLWLRVNNSAWVPVHTLSPLEVVVGDLN